MAAYPPPERRIGGHPHRRADDHPRRRDEDRPPPPPEGVAAEDFDALAAKFASEIADSVASEFSDTIAAALTQASQGGAALPPDGPVDGHPRGYENGRPHRRVYDRPSRRAHDGLFDSARDVLDWFMASLGWVVQFVIVVAILAGFFWVPEWWKARSDLRAAEEERDVLGQLLDAENAYDGMIQALNSVMALVDDATDLRLAANFQSAAASLDSARSVWREAPLSDCDALEANTDSNPGARVLVLLCTNRRQVDELIRLERVAIDGRMLVEDESLVTSWEDRSNAIDTNSQAVERLMDMIRAQSRE